eukprot:jgi/Chrzof1/1336/Cz10g03130.t1
MDNTIVIDYGTETLKAGYANNVPSDDEPRIVTPTCVEVYQGRPANGIGSEVASTSGQIHCPVQAGHIVNFDELESLVYYAVYELLGWRFGEEGSMVIAEPLFTSKAEREQLTQLLFEVFNTNGVFFQDTAALSLYAVGKLAGCVADIGHGKIDIATVSEGAVNYPGARRLAFAGQDLTTYLRELLPPGVQLSPHDVSLLKAQCARVADTASAFDALATQPPQPQTYTLPDGQEITLQGQEYHVGEAVMRPSLLGVDPVGLAESMSDCVHQHPDSGVRKQLMENLYLCGGGSGISNLGNRLLHDIRPLAPSNVNPALVPLPEYMPATTHRFAPWVGGAILAKVVHGQGHFMTKADYEELGPTHVHRKCS